jgi:hypothetical protein
MHANYVILNYSFGWGTCENGCDYRRTWTYKVYNNCTVEFLGVSSVFLYLGINEKSIPAGTPSLVNPSHNNLQFMNLSAPSVVSVYTLDGRLITSEVVTSPTDEMPWPSNLVGGLYLVHLKGAQGEYFYKVVFERE